MKYTKKRDANEKDIVAALKGIGASVTPLDDSGVPDLLVGLHGRTYLLEVKVPETKAGKAHSRAYNGGQGELTPSQVKWWQQWLGAPAVVVHSVAEALAAVGAKGASHG